MQNPATANLVANRPGAMAISIVGIAAEGNPTRNAEPQVWCQGARQSEKVNSPHKTAKKNLLEFVIV